MKKTYRNIILIMFLVLAYPTAAFANGGIPVWITTIQAFAVVSGLEVFRGKLFNLLITFICLVLIVLIETYFLKKRYFKTSSVKKIISSVFISNFASTVLGGLLLIGSFVWIRIYAPDNSSLAYMLAGPLLDLSKIFPASKVSFILFIASYNVLLCIFSYFIELPVVEHYFKNDYDAKTISRGVLRANILSYAISFFLMLPLYMTLYMTVHQVLYHIWRLIH